MENIIESIVTTLRTQLQPYVNDMKDQRRIYDAMVGVMEMMPEFQKVKLENAQLKEQLGEGSTTNKKDEIAPVIDEKFVPLIDDAITPIILTNEEVVLPTNNGIKLIILEKPIINEVELTNEVKANEVEANEVEQLEETVEEDANEVEQEEAANEVEQEEVEEVEDEVEEEVEEQEEDADEEFSIEEIDGYGNFYVSDKGNVYSITPEEDVGDFVGTIKDGIPAFI